MKFLEGVIPQILIKDAMGGLKRAAPSYEISRLDCRKEVKRLALCEPFVLFVALFATILKGSERESIRINLTICRAHHSSS